MLNTPVTKLRKDAPGSLTAAKVADHMKRRRYPRSRAAISAFESGRILTPEDRFVELYAEAIGRTPSDVRDALERTQKMRERRTGPFAATRVA